MPALRDRIAGGALVALGAAMVLVARGFPSIGAMAYGPDLFPTIVGTGLIVSGALVALEFVSEAGEEVTAPIKLIALVAIVAGFALLLDPLGFHIAGTLAFAAAIRLFGGGWLRAALVGTLGTILLHALFYTAMRVPLPWGLLLSVAW